MRTEVEKTDAELRQIQEKLDMLLKAGANDQVITMTVKSMDIQQMRRGTEKQCWILMDVEDSVIKVVKFENDPPPVWYAAKVKVYRRRMTKKREWYDDDQAELYAEEIRFGFSVADLSAIPRIVGQFIREHLDADDIVVANGFVAIDYPIDNEKPRVQSIFDKYPVQQYLKT